METSIDYQKVTEPIEATERLKPKFKKSWMKRLKKATKELLDEQRLVIRKVVEEEKKTIWERAEALREAIVKFGL